MIGIARTPEAIRREWIAFASNFSLHKKVLLTTLSSLETRNRMKTSKKTPSEHSERIKELFDLYAAEDKIFQRNKAENAKLAAVLNDYVKEIFELTGDSGDTYMHPDLGSVIAVRRTRTKSAGASYFLRHVQDKAVVL